MIDSRHNQLRQLPNIRFLVLLYPDALLPKFRWANLSYPESSHSSWSTVQNKLYNDLRSIMIHSLEGLKHGWKKEFRAQRC
jgi:hypothetical protein